MSEVLVRKVTEVGRLHVSFNIRDADRAELWELSRLSPYWAIRYAIEVSGDECYEALVDGVPIAVGGAFTSQIGGYASPWLLGTDGIFKQPRKLLELTNKYTEHLLKTNKVLSNRVHAENTSSIRYLQHAGFQLGEPYRCETGAFAVDFRMER